MLAIILLLLLALTVLKISLCLFIMFIDGLATMIAAYYRWRSLRISRALLAKPTIKAPGDYNGRNSTRRQRRLMARQLRLSIAMTTHYSLFPRSSARGFAVIDAIVGGNRLAA